MSSPVVCPFPTSDIRFSHRPNIHASICRARLTPETFAVGMTVRSMVRLSARERSMRRRDCRITVVNEVPGFPIGIPIPDWLVDWLVMDKARCKAEPWLYPKKKPETVETEKPVDITVTESAVQIPLVSSERRFIQHGLGPKAEKVPQGYRY